MMFLTQPHSTNNQHELDPQTLPPHANKQSTINSERKQGNGAAISQKEHLQQQQHDNKEQQQDQSIPQDMCLCLRVPALPTNKALLLNQDTTTDSTDSTVFSKEQRNEEEEDASTVTTRTTSCTSSYSVSGSSSQDEDEFLDLSKHRSDSVDSLQGKDVNQPRNVRFSQHPPVYHEDPYAKERDCSADWYNEHEILRFKSLRKALVRYYWSLEKGSNGSNGNHGHHGRPKRQHAAATQRMRRLNPNLGHAQGVHQQQQQPSPGATAVQSFTSTLKDFYQSVCEQARVEKEEKDNHNNSNNVITNLSPLRKRQLSQLFQSQPATTTLSSFHNTSSCLSTGARRPSSRVSTLLAPVAEEVSTPRNDNTTARMESSNSNDNNSPVEALFQDPNQDADRIRMMSYEWIGLERVLIPYLRQSASRRGAYMHKMVRDLQDQYAFYQDNDQEEEDRTLSSLETDESSSLESSREQEQQQDDSNTTTCSRLSPEKERLEQEVQSCCQVYSHATVLLAQALAQAQAQMPE